MSYFRDFTPLDRLSARLAPIGLSHFLEIWGTIGRQEWALISTVRSDIKKYLCIRWLISHTNNCLRRIKAKIHWLTRCQRRVGLNLDNMKTGKGDYNEDSSSGTAVLQGSSPTCSRRCRTRYTNSEPTQTHARMIRSRVVRNAAILREP